jgi:hypothetical protein
MQSHIMKFTHTDSANPSAITIAIITDSITFKMEKAKGQLAHEISHNLPGVVLVMNYASNEYEYAYETYNLIGYRPWDGRMMKAVGVKFNTFVGSEKESIASGDGFYARVMKVGEACDLLTKNMVAIPEEIAAQLDYALNVMKRGDVTPAQIEEHKTRDIADALEAKRKKAAKEIIAEQVKLSLDAASFRDAYLALCEEHGYCFTGDIIKPFAGETKGKHRSRMRKVGGAHPVHPSHAMVTAYLEKQEIMGAIVDAKVEEKQDEVVAPRRSTRL